MKPLINLIFYSNFWIGLCAASMVAQTEFLLTAELKISKLSSFVFFSTLFIYALHRIIGLVKVQPFTDKGRYKVISKFKNHIIFYAVLSAIIGFYFFLKISWAVKLALIIPGIISLGYVIPFLSGKKRLRDIGSIKIYLIAIVWAWVSVLLPYLELGKEVDLNFWALFVERSLFIFAITLPFDIRDLKIDQHNKVETIPSKIGIKKTKYLAFLLTTLFFLFAFSNYLLDFYNLPLLLALGFSAILTNIFIHYSSKIRHDYFFTGVLDGTMILQFILVVIVSNYLS